MQSKVLFIIISILLFRLVNKYTTLIRNDSYIFSRKFEGIIWKTLVSASGKFLVIEVRQHSSYQVSFYIFNTNNRKWVWESVTFEEQWWVSVDHCTDKHLGIVYYEDGKSPALNQSLTIDIQSKEVITNKLSHSFTTNEYQPAALYTSEHQYFSIVEKFLKDKYGISPVKGVEYLENEALIGISYYLWEEKKLANFLLITDKKGEVLHGVRIGRELASIGLGTFFGLRDSIFTFRDKNELLIYDF